MNRRRSANQLERDRENGQREPQKRLIKFRTCYHNTIWDVFRARGWKETDSEVEWDIMWADKEWMKEIFDHIHLSEGQRVNHFRNHFELTRKDNLIKNLKRIKRQLEKEEKWAEAAKFNFFPPTYLLPSEYAIFVEEWKKHPPGTVWIMKPIGKAQGKGIFLFNKLSQISSWKKDYRWTADGPQTAEAYIVQQYILHPYLIGGKKFDMRIYALVTSYYPLKIWIHRSGFARFSNHRYNSDINEIGNNYIHLTNVAVQRTSKNYNSAGCKWNIKNLKLFLISKHGVQATKELFANVQNIIVKSLQSVQRVIINDRHCFEVYGYDVLIDENLKPWLLEVNAAPSLSADTEADHELKFGVLDDVLSAIDLEHKLKGDEEHIGGFDLVYDQATNFCRTECLLGGHVKKPVITVSKTIGKKPPQPKAKEDQIP